ncbi:MAG TPA: ATP synthase F0 subunit C [Nitrospirae bacterium]|nr:ATP synthase F0 subunit C [Nitrospirota bacterium]
MKKLLTVSLVVLVAVMLMAPTVFAEDAKAMGANPKLSYYGMAVLGCGLAIGLAALGTGIGMGHGLRGATEGTARNPGVSGKIMTTLIIGIAMIESLAIYALVVVLIVLYANPFKI